MTKPKPRTTDVMRRVAIPDVHVPFHDTRAFGGLLKFLEIEQPDGIDILGDFVDCYQLSKFDKNPARRHTTQDELDIAFGLLRDIRLAAGKKCDIRFSEGNHESRVWKTLWGQSRGFAGMRELEIPRMLRLHELGITYYASGHEYQVRGVWYTHGSLIRKQAGMSARATSDIIGGSVLTGHTHRCGYSPLTLWVGTLDAWEAGHLADVTKVDYIRGHANWQAGWLLAHIAKEWNQVEMARVVYGGRRIAKAFAFRGKEHRL